MRIAAVYCIFNEEDYIEYSIKSVYDFVDKIIICLSLAPYSEYNPQAKQMQFKKDNTEQIIERLSYGDEKFVIIKDSWNEQLEHRNRGMQYCIDNGYDYYFLIDGDEVYRKDHLENIASEIAAHPEVGSFIIKCPIFWRSFKYRIPAEKVAWAPRRIFKITPSRKILGLRWPYRCRFTGINKTNSLGKVYQIPPQKAVFYHFSYAKSAKDMKEKLSTFPHAHEILDGWYENVWLNWPENRKMRNIHPTNPEKFPEVEYLKPNDLPEVMQSHPYYMKEIIE